MTTNFFPNGSIDGRLASDLRAIAQLTTQAVAGVIGITEALHQSVLSAFGIAGTAPGQTRGLSGFVYRSIESVARNVGNGLDRILAASPNSAVQVPFETPRREAVLAILNGIMGDHLAATGNPLATTMSLRYRGEALDARAPADLPTSGKLLLMVHGLCLSELHWHGPTVDHGSALVDLGYTPLYLRYNSGQHVSTNGRELAAQLEQLLQNWPTPIEELSIVAHSMGGLLTRSAVHYARQAGLQWPDKVKKIVFLATPHHGSPLERAGNWVDTLLSSTSFTAPFSKVGHLRSAGITDLRYGFVVDEDWQGEDRFRRRSDERRPVPLPQGIECFTAAALRAGKRGPLGDRLIGDGLVPLASALGEHPQAHLHLDFEPASRRTFHRMNHNALLNSPEVTEQLKIWLG